MVSAVLLVDFSSVAVRRVIVVSEDGHSKHISLQCLALYVLLSALLMMLDYVVMLHTLISRLHVALGL